MTENARYNIGDTLWFANGTGKLEEGKVVHIFDWANTTQYVLQYYAVVDHAIVCRDWSRVSENPEGPLNLTRVSREVAMNIQRRLKEQPEVMTLVRGV